jgi:hypothetical protein
MRPNFPSQIAQRVAAPLQRYWGLLRIFITCDRLFRLAGRLGESRRLPQSYVGKRLVWKRMSRVIRRFRVFSFVPAANTVVSQRARVGRKAAIITAPGPERIADFPAKCSNPDRGNPGRSANGG